MRDTKFQTWLMANQPPENMIYKQAFWKTYIFWRDRIIPMFNTAEYKNDNERYNHYADDINAFTEIVGCHISKSIVHPVLKISYKGVWIVFRCNFYDYEIAVISDGMPLESPIPNLFTSSGESFFYQGFPDKFVLADRYETNHFRFMAKVGDDYAFYVFMVVLKYTIDQASTALKSK